MIAIEVKQLHAVQPTGVSKTMKLRFMGQSYSLPQPQVTTIASEHTACYRGRKYQLRVPAAVAPKPEESHLSITIQKYRGVSYVVERRQFIESSDKREYCYQ